jgi:prepilin-type N-terminal cleavage/methylation domain-containing protein
MLSSLKAPCSKTHASFGFTLLEILVALAVAGIVLSALFAVYARVMDAAEQVQSRAEAVHTARLGLGQVARDLDSVYLNGNATGNQTESRMAGNEAWNTFEGKTPELPMTSEKTIVLSFPACTSLSVSDSFPGQSLYRIDYFLKQEGTGSKLAALQRRQTPLPYIQIQSADTEDHGSTVTVMENIKQLSILFLEKPGSGGRKSWGRGSERFKQTPALPAAVRLEFLIQDRQGKEHRLQMTGIINRY